MLLVLDANGNNAVLETYIHAADSTGTTDRIIVQHDGDVNSPKYFLT